MKTNFKILALLPVVLCLFLAGIIVSITAVLFTDPTYQADFFVVIGVVIFFILTFLWLLLGEIRTKIIAVHFYGDKISVRKFGGLAPGIEFENTTIDGWKCSILPSKGGDIEYLYVYCKGRKIAKISEFYHRNYPEIKAYVKNTYADLGFEQFSLLDEFREIFS